MFSLARQILLALKRVSLIIIIFWSIIVLKYYAFVTRNHTIRRNMARDKEHSGSKKYYLRYKLNMINI